MTLVPVGKFDVEINVNGTQRVSETIQEDKTGTNAYDITEAFDFDASFSGSVSIDANLTGDASGEDSYTASLSDSQSVNGATSDQNFDLSDDASVTVDADVYGSLGTSVKESMTVGSTKDSDTLNSTESHGAYMETISAFGSGFTPQISFASTSSFHLVSQELPNDGDSYSTDSGLGTDQGETLEAKAYDEGEAFFELHEKTASVSGSINI